MVASSASASAGVSLSWMDFSISAGVLGVSHRRPMSGPLPYGSATVWGSKMSVGDLASAQPATSAAYLAAMALVNQEHLARMIDPADQAKKLQQAAVEANEALSSANVALQAGQVTLELSKDVAPLLAKLELIDQRLQVIEAKAGGCCTVS